MKILSRTEICKYASTTNKTSTMPIKDYGNRKKSVNDSRNIDSGDVNSDHHSHYIDNIDNGDNVNDGNDKDFNDDYKVD